jgi:hypothetical protein
MTTLTCAWIIFWSVILSVSAIRYEGMDKFNPRRRLTGLAADVAGWSLLAGIAGISLIR